MNDNEILESTDPGVEPQRLSLGELLDAIPPVACTEPNAMGEYFVHRAGECAACDSWRAWMAPAVMVPPDAHWRRPDRAEDITL